MGQGNSNIEDFTAVIHSSDIIWTVADMFEKQEGEMGLASVQDQQGWVRLQEWLHTKEFAQISPGPGKKTGTSSSTTNFHGQIPEGLVIYNSPKDDSNCIICQNLKSSGD